MPEVGTIVRLGKRSCRPLRLPRKNEMELGKKMLRAEVDLHKSCGDRRHEVREKDSKLLKCWMVITLMT